MELNVNIAVAFKLWGNDDFFPHSGGSPAVAWVHWSCDLAEVKDPQEISRLVQHWRLWPKDRLTACPPPASSSPSPRRRGRSRLEVNQHKVPSKDSRFLPPCSTYSIDISQPVAYGFPIFDGKHRLILKCDSNSEGGRRDCQMVPLCTFFSLQDNSSWFAINL